VSAWIFIIGLVLLWAGVSSRLARHERRTTELVWLNFPIQVATFWGRDAKAERQACFDKFEEHKNWRNNIRFQLVNWTTFGIGATLCLLGTVVWLGDDPNLGSRVGSCRPIRCCGSGNVLRLSTNETIRKSRE
jgi:hypothetical protein